MKKSLRNISETSDLKNIREIIDVWIKETGKDRFDIVCIIFGREGVGKSSLALTIAEIIHEKQGIEFDIKKQIHYSLKAWKNATYNQRSGSVQIVDEGSRFLFSRTAMKGETVQAVQFIQDCRKFRKIHLICNPSLTTVDKYFREMRIHSAFHITSRGRVTLYHGRYARMLGDPKTRKEVFVRYTSRIKDTFRSYEEYFGAKKWKAYEEYCMSKVKQDDEVPDEYHKHTWIAPKEAMRLSSLTNTSLIKYARQGHILSRRLPVGHRRYSRESILNYLGVKGG